MPVWIEFMRTALDGVEDSPPLMPEGLAQARIDPNSGLLARPGNDDAIVEIFQAGRLPPMEPSAEGESRDASTGEDPYEIY